MQLANECIQAAAQQTSAAATMEQLRTDSQHMVWPLLVCKNLQSPLRFKPCVDPPQALQHAHQVSALQERCALLETQLLQHRVSGGPGAQSTDKAEQEMRRLKQRLEAARATLQACTQATADAAASCAAAGVALAPVVVPGVQLRVGLWTTVVYNQI